MKKNPTRTQYGFGIVVKQTMPLEDKAERLQSEFCKNYLRHTESHLPTPSIEELQCFVDSMFFELIAKKSFKTWFENYRERIYKLYFSLNDLLESQNPISSPSKSEMK
jgi:hypothetical protein